jgi:hypothetical protein
LDDDVCELTAHLEAAVPWPHLEIVPPAVQFRGFGDRPFGLEFQGGGIDSHGKKSMSSDIKLAEMGEHSGSNYTRRNFGPNVGPDVGNQKKIQNHKHTVANQNHKHSSESESGLPH